MNTAKCNTNFNHPAYINVQYFVLKDKNLNLLEKLIFSVFYSFYFSGMPIKMSDAYLADLISTSDGEYSVRHIKRVLTALEEKGYIKRYRNKKGKRLIQVTKIIETPIETNDDDDDDFYTSEDGNVIHINSTKIIPEGHPCHHEGTSMSPGEGHSCHPYNKEDNKNIKKSKASKSPKTRFVIYDHNPLGIDKDVLDGYVEMRNSIKKPLTQRAWDLILKELQKAVDHGMDVNDCLDKAIKASWRGFEYEWLLRLSEDKKTQTRVSETTYNRKEMASTVPFYDPPKNINKTRNNEATQTALQATKNMLNKLKR